MNIQNSKPTLALGLLVAVLSFGCVSSFTPAREPAQHRPTNPARDQASKEAFTKQDYQPPTYRGCDDGLTLTVAQRSAVVDAAVRQAEEEIAKNPAMIKDQDFRARVATFAASNVDDKVTLISMDRSCWAELYEGQKQLAAGQDAAAKQSGDAWRICLEAMFPDRVVLAKSFFSCFNPSPATLTPDDL